MMRYDIVYYNVLAHPQLRGKKQHSRNHNAAPLSGQPTLQWNITQRTPKLPPNYHHYYYYYYYYYYLFFPHSYFPLATACTRELEVAVHGAMERDENPPIGEQKQTQEIQETAAP